MDIINLLCSAWPQNNFWATLIKIFDVGSYAWTIILFTLVLKLVLTPLDFFQRYSTNKTTRAQAKLKPQLDKLQKQYGQNQTLLYQKQNELYKKSGFSMKGSCIVMLIYMVATLTIFLTLYNSIQYIAGFKIKTQFNTLQDTYYSSYNPNYNTYYGIVEEELNRLESQEEKDAYISSKLSLKVESIKSQLEEDANFSALTDEEKTTKINEKIEEELTPYKETAQGLVVEKYLEIKDSWLWIKNIWIADKPTVNEILTYNSYKSSTGDESVTQEDYETIMAKLLNGDEKLNGVNGYYILSILVVLVSLLSQFISRKMMQPKGAPAQNQGTMAKVMMFFMPIVMLLFTLRSSSIFSIYILANSLISTLLMPLTTKLCNSIAEKQDKQEEIKTKADYSRY
jgi:YidC/Oxa1 family membrane protein insertase